MTSRIDYITGFPKAISPDSERFEDIRKQYKLGRGNAIVWEYIGRLTSADFRALEVVLTSEQYLKLRNNKTLRDKKKFLNLVRESMLDEPKLKSLHFNNELQSMSATSENFLPTLEELLNHKEAPLSQVDSEEYLLKQARRNGLYVPISFSYAYRNIGDLTYDTKVLVFVDDSLEGEVTLRKTREYFDQWAGQTEEGIATVKIGKKRRNVKWNWWQTKSFRGIIDSTIRQEILKEKERGTRFTRL